jgi:chromosome segregation ATPase
MYSQVQELPHDTPLTKGTFLEATRVLKEGAVKLAAAAGQSDAAVIELQKEITAANGTVSMLQQEVATANTELELKAAANAALTTANTELEKKAATTAESTALLGEKLRSVHKELKDILPTKVRMLVAIAP